MIKKNAMKDLWRNVCNSVGRQTKINQVWSVIWSVRGKEQTLAENELLIQEEDTNDLLNISFTKKELNKTLKKSRISTSEKDQICYITINHRMRHPRMSY